MIELTETQVFDYIKCPLRYDAQYNIGITTNNHPGVNTLLKRVGNSFLLKLMNGQVLSPSQMKRKWDKVSEENQDIISSQSNIAGVSKLLNLYRWAEDVQLMVSDMKFPFIYTITKDQVQIRGEVPEALVLNSTNKNKYELLDLDFSDKFPDQAVIDTKLKYTLDWKACLIRVSKRYELTGIHIHHVKTGKDLYTFRTNEDVVRLNESIAGVARGIVNKVFYPRESVMCNQCDMKLYCRAWRGTIE